MVRNAILSIFENIDIFGRNFLFTFGGKEKFKSKIGGYFTIITIFITIYLIWLLGKEMITSNKPKDNQILSLRDQPLNLTLNVPLAFIVQDYRGRIFNDYDRYITFEAYYWRKKRVLGKYEDYITPEKIKMRKCIPSDFSNEVFLDFNTLQLYSGKCLDNPFKTLGGDFTSDFSNFISVKLTPCYNTTEIQNCASPEESFAFLNTKNLVISVKSEKIIYNSRDYHKPVKKVIGEDNILADPYIFNFPRYEMYEFRVETDSAYIGENITVKSYYEMVFLNDIITAYDNQGKMPKDFRDIILFEYSFFESPTLKTRTRSYIKVTEVLASLGGILKIYLTVFNFIFYNIYQRIMYEQVITTIFNFDKKSHMDLTSPLYKNVHEKIKHEVKKSKTDEFRLMSSNNLRNEIDYKQNESKKPLEKNNISFMEKIKIIPKPESISDIGNSLSKDNPTLCYKKLDQKLFNFNLPLSTHENKKEINSTSSISTYLTNKKINNNLRQTQIFGLTDHIILSFFPCFSRCSKRLRTINIIFTRLISHLNNYIDVLQMMRQFYELERLKFILFNKKQLAIFQNIGIPEDPFSRKKLNLRVNTFYDFQYDYQAQKIKAQEFFKKPTYSENSKINSRLKKMFFG
jgi:hypothetical protein